MNGFKTSHPSKKVQGVVRQTLIICLGLALVISQAHAYEMTRANPRRSSEPFPLFLLFHFSLLTSYFSLFV